MSTAIVDDPYRIADLAVAGDRDTLRELLAEEATHYRAFSVWSPLVRAIYEARQIIKEALATTGGPWIMGDLDDHPELVLIDACPHPCFDGFGCCEGCGADRTDRGEDDE